MEFHSMALYRMAGCTACAALCLLLLAACGNEVRGTPEPPAEFGARERSLVGCPSLQGVYAWPPVAGEYAGGKIPSNRTPWDGGLPVPVHGREMQIWVQQQAGGQTVLRTRLVNRERSVRNVLARQWSLATYDRGQVGCTSGMLELEPRDTHAANHYGGTGIRRGFRLARMKDGALAVGIHTLSTGHTGSFFSWGGQSYGSYKAADVEYWSWSKLALLEPGDKEPAPIDAHVPGATAP
jgi:hypothetical protein